jgi:hypothetical protein
MNHWVVLLFSMETYKLSIGRDRSSVNAGKSMVDKPVFRWISELAGFQSSESIEKVMAALTKRKGKLMLRE